MAVVVGVLEGLAGIAVYRASTLVGVALVGERDAEGQQERAAVPRKRRPQRNPETHVAEALRSAYDEAVRETIPDEFLALLGKLS